MSDTDELFLADNSIETSTFLKRRIEKSEYGKLEKIDNYSVHHFIAKYINICNPKEIFVSSGNSEDLEYIRKSALMASEESKLALESHTVHFDNYRDQGRDREHTLILVSNSVKLGDKIRTGNRADRLREIHEILKDIMQNRKMYISFYSLGPKNSDFSIPCIQITDSAYVSHSENILYRQGYSEVVREDSQARVFKFIHSQGELNEQKTCNNIDKRRVYIDLEDETVFSVNSQYAGNTVGLKKLAMRLAISRASKEGWLTEHMLLMGIHGPNNRITYFSGAFPSMCGKTSTAMLEDELILGDDIAYLKKHDGSVRSVNVEKGVFGIIHGINSGDDPIQWEVLHSPVEVILSNILVKPDRSVHWTGKDGVIPEKGYNHSGDWRIGKKDENGREISCSHQNARFTASLEHFRNLDKHLNDPHGVTLSAVVYGGRDSDTWVPVEESFNWEHGIVTKGASLESETTAATLGKDGVREFNPMSNLDFLSIPVDRYIQNNLDFGKNLSNPPIIFAVNYFQRNENGGFLTDKTDKKVWFKWMELRVHKDVRAIKTPTGLIPIYQDLKSLFKKVLNHDYPEKNYEQQFKVKVPENLAKIERITQIYKEMSDVPDTIFSIFESQKTRLKDAQEKFGDHISPTNLPHSS